MNESFEPTFCPRCTRNKCIMQIEKIQEFFGNNTLNFYCSQCGFKGTKELIENYGRTHPKKIKEEINKMIDLPDSDLMPLCPRCSKKRCYMIKREINKSIYFVCPQCRLKIEDELNGDSFVIHMWKLDHQQKLKKKKLTM